MSSTMPDLTTITTEPVLFDRILVELGMGMVSVPSNARNSMPRG